MEIDDDPSLLTSAAKPSLTAGRKEDPDQKLWRLLFGLVGVIIAFLLFLAAARYFSTHSPERMVPDQTVFSAPFVNSANAAVSADGVVRLSLTNQEDYAITIVGDANGRVLGDCAGGTLHGVEIAGVASTLPSTPVKAGQAFALEFHCSPKAVGELFSSELGFAYRSERSGLVRTFFGSVVSTIR